MQDNLLRVFTIERHCYCHEMQWSISRRFYAILKLSDDINLFEARKILLLRNKGLALLPKSFKYGNIGQNNWFTIRVY